jgi:23S rRNA pseudouridine1911/1915/1917 synthase
MAELLNILHEDDRLLVLNKPAGLVCHPTKPDGHSSLISRVRGHLGAAAHPHLINRLDRETSGLVLVAKDPVTARSLRRLWQQKEVEKIYLAIVHGHVRDRAGLIDAPLGRDEQSRVAIKNCVRPDGVPARTEFALVRRFTRWGRGFSLLRARLRTGRKHQIRIHLAHLGHPLVGDKLYGGDEELYLDFVAKRLTPAQWAALLLSHHALHAAEVRLVWREESWTFLAEPEAEFLRFLAAQPAPEAPTDAPIF